MIGVALVGALFYGLVNRHYLSMIFTRTLGPYSDSLADHGFASPDPDIWQRMAERHQVAILVEPADGDPMAYDTDGEPVSPASLDSGHIRAIRTAEDGTRVTLYWTVLTFRANHLASVVGLLILATAMFGSAFWFLQRQLKPLAWLRSGVDAVARGDFKTRVPVVRDDEIGQVADAFNVMATRVGEMIDDRDADRTW